VAGIELLVDEMALTEKKQYAGDLLLRQPEKYAVRPFVK